MSDGGCTHCGSKESVTVGGKLYCANCGLPLDTVVETPPPVPVATEAPAVAASVRVPKPTVPTANRPMISDLRRTSAPAVLDLKANQPPKPQPTIIEPVAAPAAPPEPIIETPAPIPTPAPAPAAIEPVPTPEPAPMPKIEIIPPAVKAQQRAESAENTVQHAQISKFTPAPAATPAPAPAPAQVLPNIAATAHEAMQKLLSTLPSTEVAPTALSTEVKSIPVKTSLAVASVVLATMGAYIWFSNYPKMAVKIAGSRAGLAASYPAFLPSSYKLSGAVAYGSGEITYKLASPAASSPLAITERETGWDSRSLFANYVKAQAPDATPVNSQGLTVYFYSDKATWVNHGIWYIIDGTGRLNQEQILKIVYSL